MKRPRPTAAVWILRVEDQPSGPIITVTSRSELVAPGVTSSTRYRDLASSIRAIEESAAHFVRSCGHPPEG